MRHDWGRPFLLSVVLGCSAGAALLPGDPRWLLFLLLLLLLLLRSLLSLLLLLPPWLQLLKRTIAAKLHNPKPQQQQTKLPEKKTHGMFRRRDFCHGGPMHTNARTVSQHTAHNTFDRISTHTLNQ